MIASVDDAAAVLYGGPLEGFVAARDAMAKEVRAAGDRSLADDIKALRKPTVAADALNRAIRQDPAALERLLDAVGALRATQEAMLAGDAADFAAHQQAYREAVDAVVVNATSNEVEVRAAVEAAAIGGRFEELRAAAFATPPEPSGGFGPFATGSGSAAAAGSTRSGRSKVGSARGARADADRGDRGPSAAERRLAERVRRAAEEAVVAAEAHHRATSAAVEVAAARVAELDGELAALEDRLAEIRLARDDAVLTRAEAEAAKAASGAALDDATAAREGLEAE